MRLITKTDIFLQKTLNIILNFTKNITCILLSIALIILSLINTFEYQEGLYDIDIFEVLYSITFLIITWRFFKRGNVLKYSKWDTLKKYTTILTQLILIAFSIMGITILITLDKKGVFYLSNFEKVDNIIIFVYSIFSITILYAFSPLPKKDIKKESIETDIIHNIKNCNIQNNSGKDDEKK
ncbi:hypothetical protein [Photobacterium leiognathi]|uniref:hypothetical protein n=1 Tax=Photobacterium leiognathi TaxID=553611 RepID=UPI0029812313|nr:hypothetical protein [Photobacterium leiognathi]